MLVFIFFKYLVVVAHCVCVYYDSRWSVLDQKMMKLTDVCSSKRSSELIMIATFRDASILQYYTLLFYNYYDQHGCHRLFLKRKKKFHFHIQKDAVLVVWHYRFTILIYTPIGLEKTFAFLATNQFQNWHSTQLGDNKKFHFFTHTGSTIHVRRL